MTAVEWFVREIAMKNNDINFDFWAAVEQAKEMEKQQIIDFAYYFRHEEFNKKDLEQYYNKKFKMK